jgi:hypothetical protein
MIELFSLSITNTVFQLMVTVTTSTHPIQYGSPPFHSDALENGEHSQPDVIERRDSIVGSYPVLYARGRIAITEVRAVRLRGFVRVRIWIAGRRILSLDFYCLEIIQPMENSDITLSAFTKKSA